MTPYPEGFSEWPLERRNEFFAAEAKHYRERQAKQKSPRASTRANGGDRAAGRIHGANGAKASVRLLRGDAIKPEPIAWLWPGWLARGKMHILGGAPGTGKTTIALTLAATVTRGGDWPDGSPRPGRGAVVIWSGEDDHADTLVPRLMAADADMAFVHFVDDIREDGKTRSFDPARDVEPLREAIKLAGGADLLIVDPIVSAVAGDSHKNSETRRALQPLADLASELGAALIGITHFSKGTAGRDPLERLTGSVAFGAVARVVMVAAKNQGAVDEGAAERILCRVKSNIGEDGGGFGYELGQREPVAGVTASAVKWLASIEGTGRQILGEAEATEANGEGRRVGAEDFLRDLLSEGPKTVAEVRAAAEAHCLPWRTIERAKANIGISAKREGFGKGGGWKWQKVETSHRPPDIP